MVEVNSAAVRDEADHHRFVLPIADGAGAFAYYQLDQDGHTVLTHTEVPGDYMGQGIGSALALGVFDIARIKGLSLILRCPFMGAWFAKHPDYSDVVAG